MHVLQFGMLIRYLFEEIPDWEDANKNAIGDLQVRMLDNGLIFLTMGFFST